MKKIALSLMPAIVVTTSFAKVPTTCSQDSIGCNPSLIPIRLITDNVTLEVGGKHHDAYNPHDHNSLVCGLNPMKSIQDALNCLDYYQIANDAAITILVKQGAEASSSL